MWRTKVLPAKLMGLLLLFLSGCTKTIYVPVPETHTEYRDVVRVDSLVTHDSVYVRELVKGDTIYLTETKYKYIEKVKIKSDTICLSDTISVPYEVVRTEYKMNGFQRLFFWLGMALSLLGAGFVIWKIKKS